MVVMMMIMVMMLVWNDIDENLKYLSPSAFKKKLKIDFIDGY
jgi:hypothetical protein